MASIVMHYFIQQSTKIWVILNDKNTGCRHRQNTCTDVSRFGKRQGNEIKRIDQNIFRIMKIVKRVYDCRLRAFICVDLHDQ